MWDAVSLLHAVLFGALHTFHAQLHQKINLVVVMMFTNRQEMCARSLARLLNSCSHLLSLSHFFLSQTFLQNSLVHIIYKCFKIMLKCKSKKLKIYIEREREKKNSVCLSRRFCFYYLMQYSVSHKQHITETFAE